MVYIKSIIDKIFILLVLILSAESAFSQDNGSSCFYKHFTGTFDDNMSITVDLSAQNGKVTGFYYYYFPEPGNETVSYYGKTIPLEGIINANSIVLHEFSNEEANFTGEFEGNNKISGIWEKNEKEKPIPFDITEDYSKGSVSFTCFTFSDIRYAKKDGTAEESDPKAKIDIKLLYPELPAGNILKDSIDYKITGFILNKPESIESPELLLENIAFDFFDSYYRATDGIDDISSSASFNWEKDISVDVFYNENDIISLKINKYAFTGGAHGMLMIEYVVFDTEQKKRLLLKDILKDNFENELNSILDKKLRDLNGLKENENLREAGFFIDEITSSGNFYINNDGIGFFYNVYEIAPYSSGTTELFVKFNELTGLLKSNHPFNWMIND
ncbi:MAG: hypothetical protein B6D61_05320 [Bacteroidetes bacterium 4484_249]|nr:MAG: hypothetical protein B6D61_05320 [Bacteroidetes bacterium 4484_249]